MTRLVQTAPFDEGYFICGRRILPERVARDQLIACVLFALPQTLSVHHPNPR